MIKNIGIFIFVLLLTACRDCNDKDDSWLEDFFESALGIDEPKDEEEAEKHCGNYESDEYDFDKHTPKITAQNEEQDSTLEAKIDQPLQLSVTAGPPAGRLIDNLEIEDDNFQSCIRAHAHENSWKFSQEVTYLECPLMNILSSQGVEHFFELQHLDLYENPLNILSVDKNVYLKKLVLSGINVEHIDLSQNTHLEDLTIMNAHLTSINLTSNIRLERLSLYDLIVLTPLDLSQNTSLKELHIEKTSLANITLNKNSSLTHVDIRENGFHYLNLHYIPNLRELTLDHNQIYSLDDNHKGLRNSQLKLLKVKYGQIER